MINYYIEKRTIAAISTPPGTGGIGIIRISGEKAFDIGLKLFKKKGKNNKLKELSKDRIKKRYLYYGYIIDPFENVPIDDVLIVFMQSPNSYTGEDLVEIHGHSGFYTVKKILSLVYGQGAETALPGEFTKKAFLNGRISLTQAEGVMDLINSSSSSAHKMAISLSTGLFGEKIDEIFDFLVDLQASITACIDFPEDVEDSFDIDTFRVKTEKIKNILEELIKNHGSGHQIREGFKIAIAGPPNAGKSSLLNRLLEKDRAIVTSKPGTTRDVIEESFNLDGFPLVLSDTAGIRETRDEAEKIGVEKSRKTLKNSDLILFIIDGTKEMDKSARLLFDDIKELPHIFVVNKKDLFKEKKRPELFKNIDPVYISALKNSGIEKLKEKMFEHFKQGFSDINSFIIPNQRQYELIKKIHGLVLSVLNQLQDSISFELVSFDIESCIKYCSILLGKDISDDVLDRVFDKFCIGK